MLSRCDEYDKNPDFPSFYSILPHPLMHRRTLFHTLIIHPITPSNITPSDRIITSSSGGRKAITGLSSPSYQSSNVLMSFEPQASTNNLAKLDPPGAVVEQQLGLSLESAKSRPGGASTDRPRGGAVETTRRKQSSSFQAGGGQSSRSRQITTVIAPSGSTMKMAPSWSSRGINADEKNSDPTQVWTYHFLIVDDTPSNRRMLQMVLNKRNIHCDVAQDGKEAVDMVTEHGNRYDFIFMVRN